ncbi:hypothetical protein ACQPW1_39495 [Nocardia sp. CA-128927]|uniref:hypothetical protein n=1 Tax=Nocardia sp. CA-128927 TaxID=3239975 RepID=UPI003D960432
MSSSHSKQDIHLCLFDAECVLKLPFVGLVSWRLIPGKFLGEEMFSLPLGDALRAEGVGVCAFVGGGEWYLDLVHAEDELICSGKGV